MVSTPSVLEYIMAQVLFRDLMNAYRYPGNTTDNEQDFGRYSTEQNYKHSYTVHYKNDMNEAEFLDWIIEYMSGAVLLSSNRIWFNADHDETSLILRFDGTNSYGDKNLWQWFKNPNTKRFEQFAPYNGVWSQ